MKHRVIDNTAGRVHIVTTEAADGDFAVIDPRPGVEQRRRSVAPHPLTSLRQVHGADVVVVSSPGAHDGVEADGAVTFTPGCAIAVTTADCAPVVLIADRGVAVVHAGWRGAAAGVIESAAHALAEHEAEPLAAIVGPCIQPQAYEFGSEPLDELAADYGSSVVATTDRGTPALDLHEMVSVILERSGWPRPERPSCTSRPEFFSYRTRGDDQRMLTAAWMETR